MTLKFPVPSHAFSSLSEEQCALLYPPHQASESLFLARFEGRWQGAYRIYGGAPEYALGVLNAYYTPPAPLPAKDGLFGCIEAVFLLPGEALPVHASDPYEVAEPPEGVEAPGGSEPPGGREFPPEAGEDLQRVIEDWHEYCCIRRVYRYNSAQTWEFLYG